MFSGLLFCNDELNINYKPYHIVILDICTRMRLDVFGTIVIKHDHKIHINKCSHRNQRDSIKAWMPEGLLMLRLVLHVCTGGINLQPRL